MAPIKNRKSKAKAQGNPAANTRASSTRNAAAEVVRGATPTRRSARLSRQPSEAPAPSTPSAPVGRPRPSTANSRELRSTRSATMPPQCQPESSANAARVGPDTSPGTPAASTAQPVDTTASQWLVLSQPRCQTAEQAPKLHDHLDSHKLKHFLNDGLGSLEKSFELQGQSLKCFSEAIAGVKEAKDMIHELIFGTNSSLPDTPAPKTPEPTTPTPPARTLRPRTLRDRAARSEAEGAKSKDRLRRKVATAAGPQATPSRRKKPTKKASRAVANPEKERDDMADGRESEAADGLLQLSHGPSRSERNQEDANASNDRGATESQPTSQPQPQSEPDEETEMPDGMNSSPLQAYLYRQQRLAGIPPEQMISMTGEVGAPGPAQERARGPVNRPANPSVVQFSAEGGVLAPFIPPARFEGVMRPLPSEAGEPGSTDETPENERSAADILDLHDDIYGPEGRPDRHGGSPLRAISTRGTLSSTVGLLTPSPLRRPFSNTIATGQEESSEGPKTVQNRNRMRNRRILPISARGSPHGRSSSSIAPAHVSQDQEPNTLYLAHKGFDLLGALTDHAELAFMLTEYLEPKDIMNLHACSKNWHAFIKSHRKNIILRQSIQQAPESARAFPFHCYPKLCKPKPRSKPKNEPVPDFPWLFMIMDRERIIQSIMQWMKWMSLEVPARSVPAIRKLWFLMDIPDNRRRKWTIEHAGLWSDMDLFLAGLFMIQIDSALQDEEEDGSELGAMRRLLMAQKSLSVLWDVLSGKIWQSELEVLQSYIRWRYEPHSERNVSNFFGVPTEEVGLLQYEAYGQHGQNDKLRRPDSLVIREMRRRELDVPKLYREALALDTEPHRGDNCLRWDLALKAEIEGSGLDWRNAVSLDRPRIS